MKVLLTGVGGMVGGNIFRHPLAKAHTFIAPYRKELDLLNYDDVLAYINLHKPDFIIHAAGLVGGIQANMADQVAFLVENMDMGKNIIMAAKKAGVKYVLNMASSCMYPRKAINPIKEADILGGPLEPTNEGYALAKTVTTKLCEYISKENPGLHYKTAIPCNLYGPLDKFGEHNSHMIPAVIKKIHEAKVANSPTVTIWGDGSARRESLYAEDLADFVHYAIDNFEKMPQHINVGYGVDFSINDYYEATKKAIGYQGEFIYDTSKPVGVQQKLTDNTLLKAFGWSPKIDLEEGIKKTYIFFLKAENNEHTSR